MKIQQTIEILEDCTHGAVVGVYPTTTDALKLGIEALKEVRASREEDYIGDTGLLPGETED